MEFHPSGSIQTICSSKARSASGGVAHSSLLLACVGQFGLVLPYRKDRQTRMYFAFEEKPGAPCLVETWDSPHTATIRAKNKRGATRLQSRGLIGSPNTRSSYSAQFVF